MKKQPELTAQTKQNLMEAFWQLYCQKSVEKVSVKEITAKAGYNRSTFYETSQMSTMFLYRSKIRYCPVKSQDLPPIKLANSSATPFPIDTFINIYEKNRKYYIVLLGENGDSSFQSKLKRSVKDMLKEKACCRGYC